MDILTFFIGENEYGVDILQVQEIVTVDKLVHVPQAPDFVEGVMNLRGKIVPLIRLDRQLQETAAGETNHVLIVIVQEQVLGVLVQSIREVLSIPPDFVEPVPDVLGRAKKQFLQGVCRVEQKEQTESKERLILLLNLKGIITEEDVAAMGKDLEQVKAEEEEAKLVPTLKLVTFALSDQWFALDIDEVQEVVLSNTLTPIPHPSSYILGIFNLRGTVVVALDVKTFLGFQDSGFKEHVWTVVVRMENKNYGILVDSIPYIVRIFPETVQPPLSTLEQKIQDVVKGETRLDNRMVTLLEGKRMISKVLGKSEQH